MLNAENPQLADIPDLNDAPHVVDEAMNGKRPDPYAASATNFVDTYALRTAGDRTRRKVLRVMG